MSKITSAQDSETLLKTGVLQDAMFNSTAFSCIATDEKGVIQLFNAGAERMLGYDAADVLNKFTHDEISDSQELIDRAAALSLEFEMPIAPGFDALVFKASRGIEDIYKMTKVRKDGSCFPAIVSVTALRDAQKNIIGYLFIGTNNTAGIQVDATQARLAQQLRDQSLRESEQRARRILDTATDAFVAMDDAGRIKDWNGQAERFFGWSRQEVLGRDLADTIIPAKYQEAHRRGLQRFFATGEGPVLNKVIEVFARHRDGREIPVQLTIWTDSSNQGHAFNAFIHDVSDQKQVSQYARSLIEASLDPLVTISADGKITDVNEATISVTGVTRTGLIGTDFSDYFTEAEKAREGYQLVFAEGSVTDYPLTIRHQNGRLTDVLYNASVYKDSYGNVLGVFAAARDVTEQKRFKSTLEEKNIELEHASRMKSEFLATMSHELRTPLNAIIGFSEALKDGLMGSMSDMQQEYIGDIFSSGEHLLSLINDILDLSKVEAGMMELELEAVDLKSLLSNSLSIVREKAAAHRIGLELETHEDLGVPQLDIRKTKQIVYNLLSNAVKFSAPGGRVTLRARRVPRQVVGTLPGIWPVQSFPLLDNAYNQFLEISVSDSGIGISPQNMAKLFHAFSQVDSSLARKFEGTGLGLAMVKQLAELHGGGVAVASAEGEGATFAVWLPLRDSVQAVAEQRPSAAVAPADGPTERFALVVEDDTPAADSVRLRLEAEGFIVLHAATAEAALLLAAQQSLSLITLDLQLPRFDGWEFLMQLREINRLASVPVVLMTGPADSDMVLARGASAVLQKPISCAQLNTSLKSLGLQSDQDHTHLVLVVDDDALILDVISGLLPSPAYAVVRANGGREAIILAQRLRPSLILLDLMMPDVNGFDVFEALQQHTETANIPILVLTTKKITAQDRALLHSHPDKGFRIVERTGLYQSRFMAEVKRALALN